MDAQIINTSFDLISLVQNHTTLKRAGRYWSGPCPFCGGEDRFEIKQSDRGGYVWRCRHCANSKGYYPAIDYYMRYSGLGFKAALEAMGGSMDCQPLQPKKEFVTSKIPPMPDTKWQITMLGMVDETAQCLTASPDGQPGRDYLTARGLHLGTWATYNLGFFPLANDPVLRKVGKYCYRPAITIPWLDDNGITCINYRFIDSHPEGLKKYKTMGKRTIFGLQAIWHSPSLMICEGELNCCSIHQAQAAAGGLGLSAVSIGSEKPSGLTLTLLEALVAKFEHVFTWIDRPERAKDLVDALNRPVHILKSPDRAGVKMDANAMLQEGILVDFLRALLTKVCAQTALEH